MVTHPQASRFIGRQEELRQVVNRLLSVPSTSIVGSGVLENLPADAPGG
jgi:hypothetical protein